MKRFILLFLITTFLAGCTYYRGPNYRDTSSSGGRKTGETFFGSLETKDKANKYKIAFDFSYKYRNGERERYPSGRDFKLTKQYSLKADQPGFKEGTFVSDYQTIAEFNTQGIWDFERDACVLQLANEESGLLVILTGKVERRVERYTGSGHYHTYMAYQVQESSIPELVGEVFHGKPRFFSCAPEDVAP
ncbi:lipoprotein [Litoribacillus peritrichatus]|uniref:Type IV secretion system putative lipoprotein virB7 n=1 Tax=Litoribacillus peritrichatus TaxID=718191 RepID=A0ABP7MV66_9GAMM